MESVLGQTFDAFEVLVEDNGSTDNAREVVEGFRDARVKYSRRDTNSGGPAAPRNRGIEAAGGDWICFLDAGDTWRSQKLAKLSEAIRSQPKADAMCHDMALVSADHEYQSTMTCGPFAPNTYRYMLLYGNRCITSAMSVRRSFLERHLLRFNTASSYVIVEDFDLWLRMARLGATFGRIDAVLGEYVKATESLSGDGNRMMRNLEEMLRHHTIELQSFEPEREALWSRIEVQLEMVDAKRLIEEGHPWSGRLTAVKCLLTHPRSSTCYLVRRYLRNPRVLSKLCE